VRIDHILVSGVDAELRDTTRDPAVVVPLLTTHFVMLSRNLVYTAVTRAKRLCVMVADPRAIRMALGEERREERVTRLGERLREGRRER